MPGKVTVKDERLTAVPFEFLRLNELHRAHRRSLQEILKSPWHSAGVIFFTAETLYMSTHPRQARRSVLDCKPFGKNLGAQKKPFFWWSQIAKEERRKLSDL